MTAERIKLVEMKDRRIFSPEAGPSRQVLAHSDKLMLVRHLMEEGWTGARHSHPHEQLVYIIRGHIQFSGGDKMLTRALGAPIFNEDHRVIAAVSVSGPSSRITAQSVPEIAEHLLRCCSDISASLGMDAKTRPHLTSTFVRQLSAAIPSLR